MWISKKEHMELKSRIDKLEKGTLELSQKVRVLQDGFLDKLCFNSVMKEMYNLELLKYLYEKLGIEQPKSEYDFTWCDASANKNGERNQ